MKINDKYTLEIQQIINDLKILEQGQIYEIQNIPGVPRASTLADRLKKNIVKLLDKIENGKDGDIESVISALGEEK